MVAYNTIASGGHDCQEANLSEHQGKQSRENVLMIASESLDPTDVHIPLDLPVTLANQSSLFLNFA